MRLIPCLFVMIVLLAVSAGAMNVQVIEGDADGVWDLSAKKLRAMATVYLAELGHVPSSGNKNNAVSFSMSGPVKRTIQMQKFGAKGKIEEDSVVIANMDVADDAVEGLLKKTFGKASRLYKSAPSSEVFFMDPEFIGVDDSTANLAVKSMGEALDELEYELADERHGVKLQTYLVKLKDAYWLGMVRTEGSKVIKGAHKKIMPGEDLGTVIFSLTNKVMNQDVKPEGIDSEVRDYADTHEAKCRVANGAESVSGFFAGLTADLLCELSDYLGLEMAVGSKDLYEDWYPNIRFDFTWGFSDNHAWIVGLDYAGTMGYTKSRWAFESVHRFSQKKGIFVDIIWGRGFDDVYDGWYMGGDIGLNLLASKSKAHWLSLMVRYDGNLDDFSEQSRISVNLVYGLRGYFTD